MKTLSTKASKQKILSLLLLAGLWSIMLIIVLLAAKSTWAKNLNKIAFKDIKKCEIGWYNQTFRIHSFGSEVAHPIYFKINEQMVIKTDLTSNNEHIIELANLLKSHVKDFKDPYHLVLAMNDRSITVYEYIERIIHNKIIKPNLYK